MENFKIESRYLKLCNEFRVVIRCIKATFYRPDYQKLLMGPWDRAFERLSRAFEDLREYIYGIYGIHGTLNL